MMKILIVDDEPLARSRLRDVLEDIGNNTVVGEAANGREALDQVRDLSPDVVLLDIRMPVMTGLEAAQHIADMDNPPTVIFTTAYGDHALDAFDADATDYLLKPIRQERLEKALQKVRPAASAGNDECAEHEKIRSHICAHHRGNLILIPLADIQYFQADSKYVVVRHTKGEVLIDESLKSLEEEFQSCFTRIHRNALVANRYIESLEKSNDGHHYVHLQGVEEGLAVSRRQLSVVRKALSSIGTEYV